MDQMPSGTSLLSIGLLDLGTVKRELYGMIVLPYQIPTCVSQSCSSVLDGVCSRGATIRSMVHLTKARERGVIPESIKGMASSSAIVHSNSAAERYSQARPHSGRIVRDRETDW